MNLIKLFSLVIGLFVLAATVLPSYAGAIGFGCEEQTSKYTSGTLYGSGPIEGDPREGGCIDPGTGTVIEEWYVYPGYKYVYKYNYRFTDFRNMADYIRSAEWGIVTGGLVPFVQEIAKAAKKNKKITLAMVKSALKLAGKQLPGLGTLLGLVGWGTAIYHANKSYKAIVAERYSSR